MSTRPLIDNVVQTINDFNDIQDAIIEKGVPVAPTVPTSGYGDKIRLIGTDPGPTPPGPTPPEPEPWVRPDYRPEITANANSIVMLYAIRPDSLNIFAIKVTCTGGSYFVNWSDGPSQEYNSNAVASHMFDFDTAYGDVSPEGCKYAYIEITAMGNITGVDFSAPHPTYPSTAASYVYYNVLEVYLNTPNLNSLAWMTSESVHLYAFMDFFSYEGAVVTVPNMFLNCSHLRRIVGMDRIIPTSLFMKGCIMYNEAFPENVNFESVSLHFMQNCFNYNQPFPEGVAFSNVTSNFMYDCQSYNQPFPQSVTFSNATASFMDGCCSYNQPFPEGVTFSTVTGNFLNGCKMYNQPFPSSTTFSAVTGAFMMNCNAYNQPFPEGVTFQNVAGSFMSYCYVYNQAFPAGVTFGNATTYFMRECSLYNQPFPEGVTFSNITTYFLYYAYSYNQPFPVSATFKEAGNPLFLYLPALESPLVMDWSGRTTTTFTLESNSSAPIPYLQINNMPTTITAIGLSGWVWPRSAWLRVLNSLSTRATNGVLTVTNSNFKTVMTAADKAIATGKKWTITGGS